MGFIPGVGTPELIIVGIIALVAVWKESAQRGTQCRQELCGIQERNLRVSG